MAYFPKSVHTLNEALVPLVEHIAALGATNLQMVSARSLRFDLPDLKLKDGRTVNRVKLTAHQDGTVDMRLQEVVEHELVGGVPTSGVQQALEAFLAPKA